jgi:[ribosomal protein S18]-alanine N-acetyltransferase
VTNIEIRRLGPGDDALVLAAGHVFDHPPKPEAVARFLADQNHHLFVALAGGKPVGFVSGVELTHPDKGTEMFLYELAVDERHRRLGIATELVAALRDLASRRGCYDMWVLTDHDNEPALATYRKSGTDDESSHVMLTWKLT